MENNVLKVDGNVSLTSNYELLKTQLEANIKDKYSVVVTFDNVKDSKNVMAQINKDKDAIKKAWTNYKKDLEAPIKDLDSKVKELLSLFDNARDLISKQVDMFEAGIRENAQDLAEEYAKTLLTSKNLDVEVNYPKWNNLSFVTESGKLSGTGKKAVEQFISEIELEHLKKQQEKLLKEQEEERIRQEAIRKYQEEQLAKQQAKEEPKEQPLKEVEEVKKVDESVEKLPQHNTNLANKQVIITLEFKSNNSDEVIKDNVLKELSDLVKTFIKNVEVKDI